MWRLAAAAAGVGALTFAFRYLSFESFANDHYLHLARAQQIMMGSWPVRDFAESGLPLMSLASAAAQGVIGPGLHAEVLLVASALAAAAALSVAVASFITGSVAAGLIAAILTVIAYPVSYSYPKLLLYAAAFAAACVYGARPGLARLLLLAATVVLAFLFRHDHGLILGVAAAAAVAVRHASVRAAATAVAYLGVFGLLLAAPYLLWVQVHEGLGVYLQDGLAFSARESEKAVWEVPRFALVADQPMFASLWAAPLPIVNVRWVAGAPEPYLRARERAHGLTRLDPIGAQTWQYALAGWSSLTLRRLVSDPAVADTHGIDRSFFRLEVPAPLPFERLLMRVYVPAGGLRLAGVAALYYLAWLLPAAAALLLGLGWRTAPPAVRAVVVMAIVAQLLANWTMLRDPLDTRIRDIVQPAAVLFAFACAWLWRAASPPAARVALRVAVLAMAVVVIGATAAAASLDHHVRETRVPGGWSAAAARVRELRQDLGVPGNRAGQIGESYVPVVEYLERCSPAGARLFMLTFAPELLVHARRGFAGGHESLLPGYYASSRQSAMMLRRLAREEVPFVVMDSETAAEMPASYPAVMAYIRSHFSQVATFAVRPGKDLFVLAETGRPSLRRDGAAQLPCFA